MWRSSFKHNKLQSVNDERVQNQTDVKTVVVTAKKDKLKILKVMFTTAQPISINPQEGIHQLDIG